MAHDGARDRDSYARLQAALAASLERADRAEVQLRTATEESQRLSGLVELLEQDLAEARRDLAKSREETVAVTALAATHGARAVELEREAIMLREKTYQLGLDITAMATERDRLTSEMSGLQVTVNDMTTARNQLMSQLEDVSKQQARSASVAAAAEDRHKADMQQLQVRLAASEAECRALNHAKVTMHEDLQRARAEILALQAQLQEEYRRREEQSSENRRLQRELETTTENLAQAQRLQRTAAATAEQLEEELDCIRTAHSTMETELQTAKEDVQRQQEEVRLVTERNAEVTGQLNALSATVRHLEVENLRLTDGHATLRVEIEARAAEARAARGEAAELAADRARLLAELQRKPAGADEDEASRLREALSTSRLEVARLQRELAANDAVLADAESALVALVSEKEGLQQALSVALMSANVAVDTAEELKSQVAALAVQGAVAEAAPVNDAATGAETFGANGVEEHMISYQKSLHGGGSTSEGGHGQSSATAAGPMSPVGGSAASFGGATATVRVVGPRAPMPVSPRYPPQPTRTTSDSGSAVPVHRPGGHDEAWEALSASGTENSEKESGSGEGIVALAPTGLPSATSLVIASLSLAMQAAQQQGVPTPVKDRVPSVVTARAGASRPGSDTGVVPAGPAEHDVILPSPARPTAPSPSGSHGGNEDSGSAGVAGNVAAATTATTSGSSNGGHGLRVAATSAAGTATGAEGSANLSSPAPRSSHLPPRSPQSSIGDLRELENNASSSTLSFSLPGTGPQPAQAAAATGYTVPAVLPTPNRLPAPGSALHGTVSAPAPDAHRTPPPASASLAPYQALMSAPTASDSPLAGGAGSSGAAGGYFPPVSALAGRSTVPADVASTLLNSAYRSPSRVSLVASRSGVMGIVSSASLGEGNERGTASRPASAGGTGAGSGGAGAGSGGVGAGSGGSPMVSPRVMLEARMLSRAVRPSAELLSSPLRSSSTISGGIAAMEPGAMAPQQVHYGDGVASRPSVTLTPSMSSYQQLASRQQQQQQTSPLAYRKPPSAETELAAFPSPFASGTVAPDLATPRTSGTFGATAPSPSPRASGTVRVGVPSPPPPAATSSYELRSRHISKEQQPTVISNPVPAPRPSASLFFNARRSTLTPEGGLTGNGAFSGPTPTEERLLEPQQMQPSDNVPEPQVREEVSPGIAAVNSILLPPVPSEEDAMLMKRLEAMDEAMRAIGAI
ncbi:hypothetical protein PLESTB_000477500 [Pleodorina starrii]|uniref:Uncharacterized protein n=1 Tax=Pleodorina starrii TaxID=330485 RepID=A0A9W6F013_9CHLO|nr:hypothetical protein PLESTB_000477500 [Pleodorina starrii]GLC63567.1 hypothetical protein PLESTF_000050000 [Pleodorina starrii]